MAKSTRLIALTGWTSDLNSGQKQVPKIRLVDPVVLMLTELAESAFGSDLVDDVARDIALTHCDEIPSGKLLEYLAANFFKTYLLPVMETKHPNIKATEQLKRLPPLSKDSYVDYFVLFTTLPDSERSSDQQFYRATQDIQGVLLGYQTNNAYPMCVGIVTFFKEMRDGLGLETLIRSLCWKIKKAAKKDA
jgi:hypothetical protein